MKIKIKNTLKINTITENILYICKLLKIRDCHIDNIINENNKQLVCLLYNN